MPFRTRQRMGVIPTGMNAEWRISFVAPLNFRHQRKRIPTSRDDTVGNQSANGETGFPWGYHGSNATAEPDLMAGESRRPSASSYSILPAASFLSRKYLSRI